MRGCSDTTAAPSVPHRPYRLPRAVMGATNGRTVLSPQGAAAPHARGGKSCRERRPEALPPLGGLALHGVDLHRVDVDDSVRPPTPTINGTREVALAVKEQVEVVTYEFHLVDRL